MYARRAVRREEMVVGAAVAASMARPKPVVVVPAPVAPVEVIVQNPVPGQPLPPGAYGQQPVSYVEPMPGAPIAAAGVPMVAAGAVPTAVPVGVRPAVVPAAGVPVGAAVGTAAAIVAEERRHFYLVNEANCSVLSIERALLKPGTPVVVERRRPDKAYHQIWYLDREGVIRSKLNDFALECRKIDDRVKLVPYLGEACQQWILEGNRIVNRFVRTECLGLHKFLRVRDDANVVACLYEGKPYHHWRMEPIII